MSNRSLNVDNSPVGRLAGYYGKIPLAGDFITRRMAQETISIWDNWLRHGLLYVKNAEPAREWIEQCHATIWNFVVPPSISGGQLVGLIADSRDRVGRQYPFTLFESMALRGGGQFRLDQVTPFFIRHAPILRALQLRQMSGDQLEVALDSVRDWQFPLLNGSEPQTNGGDIFSVLGGAAPDDDITVAPPPGGLLPWPGMDLAEVMRGDTSYWWTNQTMGGPLRAFTHTGGLNETLFKILFTPLQR
jgi:type VI secretion system protein ImpM